MTWTTPLFGNISNPFFLFKKSVTFLAFFCVVTAYSQQVVRLYPGTAPGSEHLKYPERTDTVEDHGKVLLVRNVTEPTLTVFRPKGANGTAVIVCPGGAFRGLAIEKEGYDIARWLNEHGITAFVLKYRIVNAAPGFDPQLGRDFETRNYARIDSINAPFVQLAVADGREAVRYLRRHAAEYGIAPDRIGMMGFSAGGALAVSVALNADRESRPDFIAPIYAYCSPVPNVPVPTDAGPLFLALADDDPIANGNAELYLKWHKAGRQAQIHVYPHGGHGFALRKQNLPCDLWTERFTEWLFREGLLMTPERAKTASAEGDWAWRQNHDKMMQTDWAGKTRFAAENSQLAPPKPGEKRVVFMGNSITEGWGYTDPSFFAGKPYVNRGISGQTTSQMLLRFKQDVLDLHPAVVVILAGTNDIAGNTGPISLEDIAGNIASMAEIARANNIKVVLSSVLPAYEYPWSPGLEPAEKIVRLNGMIKAYAQKHNIVYLDYFSAMTDERHGLPPHLAEDGIHPTLAGYKVMEPLAEKAIEAALK